MIAKKKGKAPAKKVETEDSDLTDKQVLFVAEYLIDFNATRAAMAAGYSKHSAGQLGYQLLQKPTVQAEIKRQTQIVVDTLGITSQRVLLEYLKIAFSDITHYVEFGQHEVPVIDSGEVVKDAETKKPLTMMASFVELKDSTQLDGTLISEVKQGRDGISIKLHNKMKALEKLEKYLDLLPDNHRRMIEGEKLKLAQAQHELDRTRILGDKTDGAADDGFMEALKGKAAEVWDDDEEEPDGNV